MRHRSSPTASRIVVFDRLFRRSLVNKLIVISNHALCLCFRLTGNLVDFKNSIRHIPLSRSDAPRMNCQGLNEGDEQIQKRSLELRPQWLQRRRLDDHDDEDGQAEEKSSRAMMQSLVSLV